MKSEKLIASLILSLGLIAGGYFIGNGIIKFKYNERTVAVKGLAERDVKSDKAIWNLRYINNSDSLPQLYSSIVESQEKIKKFMLSKGFAIEELELPPAVITDNQNNTYAQTNAQAKRYVADCGVIVTTNKIDKTKQAAQETLGLIEAGIVISSSYINYEYTKLNDIKSEILDEATANAKKTAMSFARNSNNTLGKIKSASQGQVTIQDAASSGELSVNKTVRIVTSVTYLLD